jgi:hypothetical protein
MGDRMTGGDFGRRALQGFAFGLGFACAAALGAFVMRELSGLSLELGGAPSAKAPVRTVVPVAAQAVAGDVRVASHRVERRNGDTIVLGTLRNEGEAPVSSVRVEAAHYDAGGRLVDLCGWYIAPRLAPGEDKPFKVACGGTPDRPSPESASVKLRVVEAW